MSSLKYKFKMYVGNLAINTSVHICKRKDNGFLGKLIFAVYQEMLHIANMSVFPVVSANKYQEITGNAEETVIETNRMGVSGNIIMAGSNEETVLETSPLPDLKLYKYSNVNITGNSDIVVDLINKYVISEEAYDCDDNLEIIDGLLYRSSQNICLLRENFRHRKDEISCGIMISGKFCNNYYHLLYENLNRLISIENANIPLSVPIIIDKKTQEIPSCKRIIDILKGSKRPVVTITSDKIYKVSVLYNLNHIHHLPSHLKDIHRPSVVLYNKENLLKQRKMLLAYKSLSEFPKRIFLSRSNTKRRRFNEDEVFDILKKYGFERLAPENYSFEEQMAIFNNAEYIVSGSGAALSNLLFVNKCCIVICFGISTYDDQCEIPVFNTIANVNESRFLYFPRKTNSKGNIHVNFEIDCEDFAKVVKSIIR